MRMIDGFFRGALYWFSGACFTAGFVAAAKISTGLGVVAMTVSCMCMGAAIFYKPLPEKDRP